MAKVVQRRLRCCEVGGLYRPIESGASDLTFKPGAVAGCEDKRLWLEPCASRVDESEQIGKRVQLRPEISGYILFDGDEAILVGRAGGGVIAEARLIQWTGPRAENATVA